MEQKAAVCVVMSAGGYPAKYEKGNEILGLDKAENENVLVSMLVQLKRWKNCNNGGRVLGVVALGDDIKLL